MRKKLRYINDTLFEVVKVVKCRDMIIPKKHRTRMDKKLIGMWVHQFGGERVLREGDKLLIVNEIKDTPFEEIT